jgi:hypothetical protein
MEGPVPSLSEMSSSPLFWESFWPCLTFGVLAVTFLTPLLWFWFADRSSSRRTRSATSAARFCG